MNRNHCFIITLIAIFISVEIGFCFGKFSNNFPVKVDEKSENIPIDETYPEESLYMVKEYENKIAIFVKGNPNPDIVFDVYLNQLPEEDKIQLKRGIPVNTYEILISLIEDLIS